MFRNRLGSQRDFKDTILHDLYLIRTPFRTVNTLHIGNTNQLVNAV